MRRLYIFFYFLNIKDPQLKNEDSVFLQKIRAYNQGNCSSVKKLRQFLWNIKQENKINYMSLEKEDKEQNPEGLKAKCSAKAEKLLQEISKKTLEDDSLYICQILAELLKFHIREDKPGWWDYFSHLEMNAEEMLQDGRVITDCRVVESARNNHKIQFEKEQEISLKEKDLVILLESQGPAWTAYKIFIFGSYRRKPLAYITNCRRKTAG